MNFEEENNTETQHNTHIKLKLDNFHGRYGCMAIFEDSEEKNELRYKLDVKFLKHESTEKELVYMLDRKPDIYINDKAPDSIMEELAIKTSQAIYPLKVMTHSEGTLKAILNFVEIVKRWEIIRGKLREYYKGETVEKYLKLNDKTLSSYDFFYKKMSNDWFIQLYFSALYVNYFDKLQISSKPSYTVAGNAGPVNYEAKQSLENLNDKKENSPLFIKIKGEIKDTRCALDLEQELEYEYYREIYLDSKDLKGTCNLIYSLNRKTGVIEGLEAKFNTKFQNPKKVAIKMFLLEDVVEIKQEGKDDGTKELSFWAKFLLKVKK